MLWHVIEVDMDPVPKDRPRFGRGGRTYTPAKTVAAENTLRSVFSHHRTPKMDGPCIVSVEFTIRRPRRCKRQYPSVGADVDNLFKLVADAGNGILWEDDKLIIGISARKIYGSDGKIVIRYSAIPPDLDLLTCSHGF